MTSDRAAAAQGIPYSLKIVVAGGCGAGKATLVGAISDIPPMRAEDVLAAPVEGGTEPGECGQDAGTTVAMDFGRLTLDDDIMLYLFGTPAQGRSVSIWDELSAGALGAVVVADPRRPCRSQPSVDYLTDRAVPFLVAVNCFDDARPDVASATRGALHLSDGVPVLSCDARDRESVKAVLVGLVHHVLAARRARAETAAAAG